MKWILIIMCSLIIIVILFFTALSLFQSRGVSQYNKKVKQEITTSQFIEVDAQKVNSAFKSNQNHIVYVGRPTCPECQSNIDNLISAVNENNQTILYFDTDSNRELKNFHETVKSLKVSEVPSLVSIKNGEVISTLVGVHSKEKILEWLKKTNSN